MGLWRDGGLMERWWVYGELVGLRRDGGLINITGKVNANNMECYNWKKRTKSNELLLMNGLSLI